MSNATIDHDDLDVEQADDDDLVRRLRARNRELSKQVKNIPDLEVELRTLKLDKIVRDADLGDLNETQRETLAQWAERQTDVSADSLRERAVALGWAEAKPDPAAAEIDEHEAISQATSGAPPKGGQQITPEETRTWGPEKTLQFRKQHPEAFERLKRGETVAGITF